MAEKNPPDIAAMQNPRKFDIDEIIAMTDQQIEKGESKPTASNGHPMADLHGAAKFTAMEANVGGGSKATGGKGMEGGQKVRLANMAAKGIKAGLNQPAYTRPRLTEKESEEVAIALSSDVDGDQWEDVVDPVIQDKIESMSVKDRKEIERYDNHANPCNRI